jgi:hypothetical protein
VLLQPVLSGGATAFGVREQRERLRLTQAESFDLSFGGEQFCSCRRSALLEQSGPRFVRVLGLGGH